MEMTGVPQAIASVMTLPNPSQREDSTKLVARDMKAKGFFTKPRQADAVREPQRGDLAFEHRAQLAFAENPQLASDFAVNAGEGVDERGKILLRGEPATAEEPRAFGHGQGGFFGSQLRELLIVARVGDDGDPSAG